MDEDIINVVNRLKPLICPKCGGEVSYLKYVVEEIHTYIFERDEYGKFNYTPDDSWPGDWEEYSCPHCYEVLFTNEEDAQRFLRGEE